MNRKLRHLLSLEELGHRDIMDILALANKMLATYVKPGLLCEVAKGKLVASLFFEPSTRTANSFEIAAKRLGALTVSPHLETSSLLKGESLLDTVHTLEAMGANVLIIRHPEHGTLQTLAKNIKKDTHLINAGEGWLNHPTQALLDLMTIQQNHADWSSLSIAIVGDLFHSRVARSLIDAFGRVGIKDLRLIAPSELQPEADLCKNATCVTTELTKGLKEVDIIVCLRLQKERTSVDRMIPEKEFITHYQISTNTLKYAKKNALVMHPGPMNRGIEITSEVADSLQSAIFRQVQNGVALRMALLHSMLGE